MLISGVFFIPSTQFSSSSSNMISNRRRRETNYLYLIILPKRWNDGCWEGKRGVNSAGYGYI